MSHLERLPPGRAPGGIVVRVSTFEGDLISETIMGPDDLGSVAGFGDRDGGLAIEHARPGRPTFTHLYDGDSGECLGTFIVEAP